MGLRIMAKLKQVEEYMRGKNGGMAGAGGDGSNQSETIDQLTK